MKRISLKLLSVIFMLFWMAFTILPVIVLLPASLKTSKDFYKTSTFSFENGITFENYKTVFSDGKFLDAFVTTALLVILSVLLTTLISASIAYVIERFNFKFKSIFIKSIFILAVVPMIVLQVFVYQALNFANLHDSILGLVIVYSTLDIVIIYMFRELFKKIPLSIDKSARLTGASDIEIFFKIMLPSLKEGVLLVLIFKTIVIYNDFYLQFLMLPTNKTVSTYLYTFIGTYSISWPHICATVVLSILPVVVLIIVLGKRMKRTVSTFDM